MKKNLCQDRTLLSEIFSADLQLKMYLISNKVCIFFTIAISADWFANQTMWGLHPTILQICFSKKLLRTFKKIIIRPPNDYLLFWKIKLFFIKNSLTLYTRPWKLERKRESERLSVVDIKTLQKRRLFWGVQFEKSSTLWYYGGGGGSLQRFLFRLQRVFGQWRNSWGAFLLPAIYILRRQPLCEAPNF